MTSKNQQNLQDKDADVVPNIEAELRAKLQASSDSNKKLEDKLDKAEKKVASVDKKLKVALATVDERDATIVKLDQLVTSLQDELEQLKVAIGAAETTCSGQTDVLRSIGKQTMVMPLVASLRKIRVAVLHALGDTKATFENCDVRRIP